MKKIIKFTILILLLGFVFIGGKAKAAISINATGWWDETIDASDLQQGAGSDLKGSYESMPDQVSISISGTTLPEDNWRVYVKKDDTNWHGDFLLSVRRTSEGTGFGSISEGGSYQEVTDADRSFFIGSGDGSGVKVQLKLNGITIQIPPDNYTTTVYYTVVDI